MTTIVSRLFADVAAAEAAVQALVEAEATSAGAEIVTAEGGPSATRIAALDVDEDAAATYAAHIDQGAALVVVRAEFAPLGVARAAMETLDALEPLDVGVANENRYLTVQPKMGMHSSVIGDHPRYLTFSEGGRKRGLVFNALGIKALSARKERRSVLSGAPFMSSKIIPLLDGSRRKRTSASAGGTITGGFFRTVSRSA